MEKQETAIGRAPPALPAPSAGPALVFLISTRCSHLLPFSTHRRTPCLARAAQPSVWELTGIGAHVCHPSHPHPNPGLPATLGSRNPTSSHLLTAVFGQESGQAPGTCLT